MKYASKTLSQMLSINSLPQSSGSNVLSKMTIPELEPIIQIESDLRTIVVPDELKNIAVAGDHFSETIYFSCPRYFDGQDLSEHNCIIRFVNAGNEYGECKTIDLEVDEDVIKFGWKIDNHTTRYSGYIYFTVQFETVTDSIEYQWQTTPAELFVLSGLNIEAGISDKDDLIFRSLTNRISVLEDKISQFEIALQDIKSLKEQSSLLQTDVDYLKTNVAYIDSDE